MATTVSPEPRGGGAPEERGAMRVSSERLFGRQIRFAIRTLRKQPSRGDRRLFGNQLRFAYRTLRDAIRQEREAGVPGAQEMREAVPASQEERGGVSSGLAHHWS